MDYGENKSAELSIEEILKSIKGSIINNIKNQPEPTNSSAIPPFDNQEEIFELTEPVAKNLVNSAENFDKINTNYNENSIDIPQIKPDINLDIKEKFGEYILKNSKNSINEKETLISTATAEKVVKQVQNLQTTFQQVQQLESKILNDEVLKNLTMELIKPKLSAWLDRHLEKLVSDIIQKEIQKLLSKTRAS